MRTLWVYPTHENCNEVAADASLAGLDAAVYPLRSTDENKGANCWNFDADEAECLGFPVVKTVCPTCPHRSECGIRGYLAQIVAVNDAAIAICTHKRAEYSGLRELSANRSYVSIHENAISILRPKCDCSATDLTIVRDLFYALLNDPAFLNWFGDVVKVDDQGNLYHDEEREIRRDRLYEFCKRVADVVDELCRRVVATEKIVEWPIPSAQARPQGIEQLLFRTSRRLGLKFSGQPWRFILSAAAGELSSAAILVTPPIRRRATKGEEPSPIEHLPTKSLLGFRHNAPAEASVTWFNDATISAELLSSVLGHPVTDQTPCGRIELQKKAVQVLQDINRQTLSSSVQSILRGVLTERSQFKRIGVIGHRTHMKAISGLEPSFRRRIVRKSYFGSGDERSSNAWHRECDLIVIIGTPRVPPNAIREYLIQIGRVGAAARNATWGPIRWTGTSESGERITVEGKGYHDDDWRQAHRDLVRAALVQAIGRGRGILEKGCEVVVFSNEECGIPVSDASVLTLNATELSLLVELKRATAVLPNNTYIEKTAVSTSYLASKVGLSVRRTRVILSDLDQRGLVIRVGERGGWLPLKGAASLDESCEAVAGIRPTNGPEP